jgi:hypothetical protein
MAWRERDGRAVGEQRVGGAGGGHADGQIVTVVAVTGALAGSGWSCSWIAVGLHWTAPLTVSKPLSGSKRNIPSTSARNSHGSCTSLPARLRADG